MLVLESTIMETVDRDAIKRQEFGDFLKSRRARLLPEQVGLTVGTRRRTPGLRREEVAMLSGVGTTWYTWLEQGREVRPSYEVLWALASTLKLDDAECRYLFDLAGRPMRDKHKPARSPLTPPEALLRMLRQLTNQPAYILGPCWEVLAWNQAAAALFGDYGQLEGEERNIIHMLFNNPQHRQLLIDWESLAPTALGLFRAESAHLAGQPERDGLVTRLLEQSADFRYWWGRHDVALYTSSYKRISHPQVGPMLFEHNSFTSDDGSRTKLVMYTPMEEDQTVEKIDRLMRGLRTAEAL